jgi:methyl-accepting chemotaxis protein
MRIRSELLIVILIVLIIPLLVIAGYSTKSITANAKEEMSLRANSLAERCNSTFSEIERQCCVLVERARDIKNNPEKYKDLYKESEYYEESRGAFVATKPEDPLDKWSIWVPNTVQITRQMKREIGLTKNLEVLYRAARISNPNVEWVAAYYENGIMLCYPFIDMEKQRPSGSHDPRVHPTTLKVKEDPRDMLWSDPYWDIGGQGWIITCFAKVYDKNNELVCLQSMDVTLRIIEKEITRAKLYDTGYVFLIDEKGNLLAFPEENENAKEDLLVTLEGRIPSREEIEQMKTSLELSLLAHPNEEFVTLIEKALEGKTLPIEEVKLDKEKYLAFVPIRSTNWAVGVVVPVGEVLAPVRNAVLIALIVAVVVALGASLFTGKRIAQPLVKLSKTSNKIAKGDLLARVSTKSPIREFSEVSKDINRMVDSLQSNIEELRKALGSYNKVLNEVALGNLAARVDTEELKKEYKLLGDALNSIVSILDYDTEELKRSESELTEALTLYGYTLEKIVDEGDLSIRIDTDKLSGKHKLIGTDMNLLISALQTKMEESKKREKELKDTISAFSKVLTKAAKGDLAARIDTKGWSEELKEIGMAINLLIESLKHEKKRKVQR